MPYDSTMAMVAVDTAGQPASLTLDENGALRFAGAPAVVPGAPSPGPRPSGHAVLYLARAPNGNPALIQLDATGAIVTVGDGAGGGDGGDGGEFMPVTGGQFTGTVMFADKADFLISFDGVSRYFQWGNGFSDSIEEATGKRYWVGPSGPQMSLTNDGTLGVSGPGLFEGPVTLEAGNPTAALHATTKTYVDGGLNNVMNLLLALQDRVAALEAAAAA